MHTCSSYTTIIVKAPFLIWSLKISRVSPVVRIFIVTATYMYTKLLSWICTTCTICSTMVSASQDNTMYGTCYWYLHTLWIGVWFATGICVFLIPLITYYFSVGYNSVEVNLLSCKYKWYNILHFLLSLSGIAFECFPTFQLP